MKFLLLCTLILSIAFFMASATPREEVPKQEPHHHHHVRSLRPVEIERAPPKHDDVACCG